MLVVLVLALPDFSQPSLSSLMLRGMVRERYLCRTSSQLPIFSQVLSAKNRLKSIYKRELMATVLSIQKWRRYVFFIIRTEQSLKFLLEQHMVQGEFQR